MTSPAQQREVLAAQMLAAGQVTAHGSATIPKQFYWWATGTVAGVGLLIYGAVAMTSHPMSDGDRATAACEATAQTQLQAARPPRFDIAQSVRTGYRTFTINGTATSVDLFGSDVQTVWTCTASSDGSHWNARIAVL